MPLVSRPSPLLFLLLLLAACGFQPMYGAQTLNGGKTAMRGNIAIDPIKGREGQLLKSDLEDRFNPEGLDTTNAQYRLVVTVKKTLIPAVVKSDSTIQRYDVRFDSDFKLFQAGFSQPLFKGALRRTGSYNVAVNANFATYEAEQDIIGRTLKEMAEDYVFRVSGFLAGAHADPKPDNPPDRKPFVSTPASALTLPPAVP